MNELTWTCDICTFPIADGAGYLAVDMDAVAVTQDAVAAFKAQHPHGLSIDELMRYPDDVPWRVVHADCDPAPNVHSYWLAVERCRSHAALLGHTAHLMTKRWLEVTDWERVIAWKAGEQ